MDISKKLSAELPELKKRIKSISGKTLEASSEQLVRLSFPVATYSIAPGLVTSFRIFFPGKSCADANLLDVAGSGTTGADGKSVFRVTQFICSDINSFAAPVNVLVTPNAAQPVYVTRTHALIDDPNQIGNFNDLEIVVHSWGPGGQPIPNIAFDWRCRLVQVPIIL